LDSSAVGIEQLAHLAVESILHHDKTIGGDVAYFKITLHNLVLILKSIFSPCRRL